MLRYIALFLVFITLSDVVKAQDVNKVTREGQQVFYPYSDQNIELRLTPKRFTTIYFEPGEKISKHTRPGMLLFSYKSVVTEGKLQQAFQIKPTWYGVNNSLIVITNKRRYYFSITGINKAERGEPIEESVPTIIAFRYGNDLHSLPPLEKDKNLAGSTGITDSLNFDITESPEDTLASVNFSVGKHGFPWKPEMIYKENGNLYIQATKEVTDNGLPEVYEITEDGDRQELDFSFNNDKNLFETAIPASKAVMVYRFEHPGLFGLYTTSSERQLFIHFN